MAVTSNGPAARTLRCTTAGNIDQPGYSARARGASSTAPPQNASELAKRVVVVKAGGGGTTGELAGRNADHHALGRRVSRSVGGLDDDRVPDLRAALTLRTQAGSCG